MFFDPVTSQDRNQFFTVNIQARAERANVISSLLLGLLITCAQLNLAIITVITLPFNHVKQRIDGRTNWAP